MTDNIVEEAPVQGEESSVIKTLREKVRSLEGELRGRPHYEDVEAEVQKRVTRHQAATDELVRRGYSPNMVGLLTREVEGDITAEAVDGFLDGLGLPTQASNPKDVAREVGKVANLASRVATAASPDSLRRTIYDSIAEAASTADIDRIMREAGLAE